MKRIGWLVYKELMQLRRDPRLLRMLMIAPLIQLVFLGYASDIDVTEVVVGVRNDDATVESREFLRSLGASGYLKTVELDGAEVDDGQKLIASRVGLVLVVPPGFGEQFRRGEPAAVQVLVDGADSNFAVQGLGYVQRAAQRFSASASRSVVLELERRGVTTGRITTRTRVWYNPELRSVSFMLPAIMSVLLLVTTMIITAMALVKEREQGTMEQLMITPLRPMEIILGKLLPFALIGFVVVGFATMASVVIFRIPFRGSVGLLYLTSALFLLTTLGLGLLVSTWVRTQQQAMFLAGFGIMMPFFLLSGFIFPIDNMPEPIQWFTYLIPMRYYLICLRGIFLKGNQLIDLWQPCLAMLGLGGTILAAAVLKFHKRLDD